jgi:hypothetical protein
MSLHAGYESDLAVRSRAAWFVDEYDAANILGGHDAPEAVRLTTTPSAVLMRASTDVWPPQSSGAAS